MALSNAIEAGSQKLARPDWWREVDVPAAPAVGAAPESNDPPLSRLLNLFPAARPMNIAVVAETKGAKPQSEKTNIVAGSADIAVFQVKFPITGTRNLQVRPVLEKDANEGTIVALMPYGRGLAVAVRFSEAPKWLAEEFKKSKK